MDALTQEKIEDAFPAPATEKTLARILAALEIMLTILKRIEEVQSLSFASETQEQHSPKSEES